MAKKYMVVMDQGKILELFEQHRVLLRGLHEELERRFDESDDVVVVARDAWELVEALILRFEKLPREGTIGARVASCSHRKVR